jgi:hypothetical protein
MHWGGGRKLGLSWEDGGCRRGSEREKDEVGVQGLTEVGIAIIT